MNGFELGLPLARNGGCQCLKLPFCACRSPQRSASVLMSLRGSASNLQQQSFKTRHGLPYRLVFTIHEDIVEVVAIRGSGQDWLRPDEIDIAE